ncbi:MAG: CDP-diacylglycerol--serine O-phosphatidyltransferase [Gammaproteobacteria bacterium]|nr:CDP-diacylglycerol--serine O-phosphatidyltransferase [Gammaproteobacteria bacterium]
MKKEQVQSQLPKATHPRGIYLLPNLFTTAALFAGFYAIIAAVKYNFDTAAIAIFVAMVADTLDGRVARLTNTQTAFGAEYDSLSDMVSFGVAPAVLAYSYCLSSLGKIGWLIVFLYTAATALRLARFNTQVLDEDKRYFQGVPCPAAAGVLAGAVWLGTSYHLPHGLLTAIPLAVLTIFVAALMVSTIRYYSFKKIDLKGKVPFIVAVLVVVITAGIALDPPQILFSTFFLYALSGPIFTLLYLRRVRRIVKMRRKKH